MKLYKIRIKGIAYWIEFVLANSEEEAIDIAVKAHSYEQQNNIKLLVLSIREVNCDLSKSGLIVEEYLGI